MLIVTPYPVVEVILNVLKQLERIGLSRVTGLLTADLILVLRTNFQSL